MKVVCMASNVKSRPQVNRYNWQPDTEFLHPVIYLREKKHPQAGGHVIDYAVECRLWSHPIPKGVIVILVRREVCRCDCLASSIQLSPIGGHAVVVTARTSMVAMLNVKRPCCLLWRAASGE
jgi:hypothetical protein